MVKIKKKVLLVNLATITDGEYREKGGTCTVRTNSMGNPFIFIIILTS